MGKTDEAREKEKRDALKKRRLEMEEKEEDADV